MNMNIRAWTGIIAACIALGATSGTAGVAAADEPARPPVTTRTVDTPLPNGGYLHLDAITGIPDTVGGTGDLKVPGVMHVDGMVAAWAANNPGFVVLIGVFDPNDPTDEKGIRCAVYYGGIGPGAICHDGTATTLP